ncbi:beta-ketoacyl synthase N-terminal-like domain-containing protein [Phycisphaerales bacterium AB-hyl4]|uniref:Beta-ketoacyl synthase N-terminal-like domain-containing protein n=1 Tax=Natronomicrosphaera hydrolytica TaxID=3242702 RepID=A0ABV4U3E2_9BACT
MRDVVITGSGLVSALGLDRQTTWQRICQGESGLGPLTALEQQPSEPRDGGQAPALPGEDDGRPREVRYLRHAIADALKEAGLGGEGASPYAGERCGLVFGTTLHGMRAGGAFFRANDFTPLHDFQAAAVLNDAAEAFGLTGIATTTCSACSSGLSSIALAVTLLQTGELDMVVAGGYDPISEYAYAGFNSLRLVAEGPPRPFGRGRQGMKLGEGYGAVVLERADDARRRRAKPIGRVVGFGESADAHHLTQPHPEGRGAVRAIREALASAELSPADIDLVTAHATGTPDNERGEYAALKQVFEETLSDVPVVAFKSWLGHTLGGAGTVECILTLCALNDGYVPPTDNVEVADLEYPDLRFARHHAEPKPLRYAINLSLGFGGANTCVVFAPPTAEAAAVEAPTVMTRGSDAGRRPVVTGIGVLLPNAIGHEALMPRVSAEAGAPVGQSAMVDEAAVREMLQTPRARRMSDYVKLALCSAKLACSDAGLEDGEGFGEQDAAIAGSSHGSASYCADYYRQVVEEGIEAANAVLFAEGVPNAAAAHLSLMFKLTGPCQTIIGSRTAGLDALHLAALRIEQGQWDRAMICAAEEATDIVRDAYRHCGLHAGDQTMCSPFDAEHGFVLGNGAVTLMIESQASAERRGAKTYGVIESSTTGYHSPRDARGFVGRWGQLLDRLGGPRQVISSANSTWIGRAEASAVASARADATVSSVYGHFGEMFSVGPFAAIAAALLAGKLPALRGGLPTGGTLNAATGNESADDFAVLCSDYAGSMSAVRVRR